MLRSFFFSAALRWAGTAGRGFGGGDGGGDGAGEVRGELAGEPWLERLGESSESLRPHESSRAKESARSCSKLKSSGVFSVGTPSQGEKDLPDLVWGV